MTTTKAGVGAVAGLESEEGWTASWSATDSAVGNKSYSTGIVASGSRPTGEDYVAGGSYLVCGAGWIQKGTKMLRSTRACGTITLPEAEIEEVVDEGAGDGAEVIQESSDDGILSGLADVQGAGAGMDGDDKPLPVQVVAESHASALAFSFAAVALSAIVM